MTGQENPHLKLASIIARKYVTIRAMGHGGYGVVYEVAQLKDPKMRFACKAEVINNHDNLKIEWQVMKVMKEKHAKHGVRAIERGQQSNFNYLVMSLMGPSLSDLRRRLPNRTFSLFTTSVVAIQTFDAVRELHDLGYLHRDVKPSNFVIGIMGTAKESLVHILDFGISRSIYKSASGQNIFRKPRKVVPFRGTLAYCSLNVHIRVEPGRHDDLWSWLYMLTEFHLGDLPWHGLDREHVKASKEEKQDELLEKCPCEFRLVRFHLDCLAYNKIPLYDELRELMCQVLVGNQFKLDVKLDWQAGGKHGDLFRRPKTGQKSDKESEKHKKYRLSEILAIPEKLRDIKESDLMGAKEISDAASTVSTSDDTIIASVKQVKKVAPEKLTRPPPRARPSRSRQKQFGGR